MGIWYIGIIFPYSLRRISKFELGRLFIRMIDPGHLNQRRKLRESMYVAGLPPHKMFVCPLTVPVVAMLATLLTR